MSEKNENTFIEGKRPVVEALRSGVPMEYVMMADNLRKDGLTEDIRRKARNANVPVKLASRKVMDGISQVENHQGVIAKAIPYQYAKIADILKAANRRAADHDGAALVVVLDHITDAGNLGAIVRSAEVVGAAGVIIPSKRSARVSTATYKTSAGAIAHVPVALVSNIAQTMDSLKKEGFWVAGASEHARDVIWDTNLKGKIALVMGNEGEGLARLTMESCDFLVKLPVEGQVGSLNVAQAATACMYEFLRQNTPAPVRRGSAASQA